MRYGSVEIDPNISLVVEQLLGAVGKVMSYTSFTYFIKLRCDESAPVRYGSVETDPNISLVVEQLWGAVGKVMSYTSKLVEPLFNNVGVTAD